MSNYHITTPDDMEWIAIDCGTTYSYKRMKDEFTIENLSSFDFHARYPHLRIGSFIKSDD